MRALTLPDPLGEGHVCNGCFLFWSSEADALSCARSHPPVIPGPWRSRVAPAPAAVRWWCQPREVGPVIVFAGLVALMLIMVFS